MWRTFLPMCLLMHMWRKWIWSIASGFKSICTLSTQTLNQSSTLRARRSHRSTENTLIRTHRHDYQTIPRVGRDHGGGGGGYCRAGQRYWIAVQNHRYDWYHEGRILFVQSNAAKKTTLNIFMPATRLDDRREDVSRHAPVLSCKAITQNQVCN